MADVGDLRVKLSLTSADFERSVANMNRTLKAMGQEIRGLQNRGKEWGSSIEGLKQKQDAYGRLLDGQRTKVQKLNEQYQRAKQEQGENAVATQRLAEQLNRANAEMNRTERELNEVTSALQQQEAELARSQTVWARFGEAAQQAGAKLKAIGQSMTSVGKTLSMSVTAPITALAVGATKAAIDFESAFAGVRKTVDTSEAGFAKLEKGILEMARTLPASASEIAGVAEAAGQLGIAEENILGFTRTIIDLGESTNLTLEQASSEFARFANITGMSQQDFDRLGSSIVALGNNMATTESEIMSMAMRLAAQGKQVGMSEAQIVALSGTLSSLGIEAEAGGTAMTTILKKIQTAVGEGGASLEGFAKAAGMSSAEFKAAFEKDAVGALDVFVKGLAKSGDEGKNLTTILADLGIKGVYESDTLLRLAGASDLLSDAVKTSSDAWTENSALSDEAAQRYETTASQLAMLKNKITEIGIAFGQVLIPMLMAVVDAITPMVEKFAEMDEKTRIVIIAIAGIAAAIGPALIVIGTLLSSIGTIVSALGAMSAAVASAGGAAAVLGTAITVMTGPIGLAIAAVAGLTAGAVALFKHFSSDAVEPTERFGESIEGLSEKTREAADAFYTMSDEVGQAVMDMSIRGIEMTGEMATGIQEKMNSMNEQILTGMQKRHDDQIALMQNHFLNSSALSDAEEELIIQKQQNRHNLERIEVETQQQRINEIMNVAREEKRALTQAEADEIQMIRERMNEQAVTVLTESEVEQKIILERLKQESGRLTAEQAAEVAKNSAKQRDEAIKAAEEQYDKTLAEIIRMRDETGDITAEQADKMIAEAEKAKLGTVKHAENMHSEVVTQAQQQATEHVDKVNWETGEVLTKWEVFKNNTSRKWQEIKADTSQKWKQMQTDILNKAKGIVTDASKKWEELKTTTSKKYEEVKNEMKKKMDEASKKVLEIVGKIPGKAGEKAVEMVKVGQDLVQGMIDGILEWGENAVEAITGVVDGVINKAKSLLKIKSPSRVFMQIGRWTSEGWAIGIEDSGNKVINAVSDIALTAKDIAEHYAKEEVQLVKATRETIAKLEKDTATEIAKIKQRSNEDVLKIQKAAWAKRRKTNEQENIKIRRIQEDAAAKILKLQETANKKKLDMQQKNAKDIITLNEKMNKDLLEETKRYIDDKKSLDEFSLIQEAAVWEQAIKLFDEGSKERVKAQQEYKKAVDAVNKEILSINQSYQQEMKKINDDLLKQENDLNKAYEDSLSKRQSTLQSFAGTFDAFQIEIKQSGFELLNNLQSQVDGFKKWQEEFEKLSNRNIDASLMEELSELGVKALPQLIALNQLTDEQLSQYSDLYQEKSQLAREQAEKELSGMREDTDKQILALRESAGKQLDKLQKEWDLKIKALTRSTAGELSSLQQIGVDAGQGLLNGLASMQGPLIDKANEIANTIKSTIQSALDIHSPSRTMRGFGVNIGEGLVLGMDDMLEKVKGAAQRLSVSVDSNFATPSQSQSYDYSRTFAPTVKVYTQNSGADAMDRTLRRLAFQF